MKRWSAVAVAALFLAMPCAASADIWPQRPVRVIVPFAAGGATDVAARLVCEFLARRLNTTFLVDNRGGAGGNLGMTEASRAAPDGYTLMFMNDAIASNPHYYALSFNPLEDFVPVIELSRQPVVVAVHPSLGVTTLGDLVALAKAKPGLSYATAGAGSQHNILGEWFAQAADIKLTHVAYRGGGPAINDLRGGHIPIAILAATPFIPLAKAGQIKLVAQSMDARASSLPDVPTFKEQGFREISLDQWTGVFVPKGTSPALVAKINAEIGAALKDPQIRAKLDELAVEIVGGSSESFAGVVRSDFQKYGKLIAALGLKADR